MTSLDTVALFDLAGTLLQAGGVTVLLVALLKLGRLS